MRISDPSHNISKIEKFTQKELCIRNQALENINHDVLLLLLSSLATSYQGTSHCLPLLLGLSRTSPLPFPPYSNTTMIIADDWLRHAFPSPTSLRSCINKANMFTYNYKYGAHLAIDAIYNLPTSQIPFGELSEFARKNTFSQTVYKAIVQYLPGINFNVNDLVEVNKNNRWDKGMVRSINSDGSLNITYSSDNCNEDRIPEFLVRRYITASFETKLRQNINPLHVGASVLANYRELNKWYEGKLIAMYPHQGLSDTSERYLYDIKYSDGVIERNVKESCIVINRRARINLPCTGVSEEIVVEEVLSRIETAKSYINHHQYYTECMSSTNGVILGPHGCVLVTLTAIDLLLVKSTVKGTSQRSRRSSLKMVQYPYLPDGISKLSVNADNPSGTYWTLIPLRKDTVFNNHNNSILSETIDVDGAFVNQGVHQLPLFEGHIPEELIWSADPLKTLIKGLRYQANRSCKTEKTKHRESSVLSLQPLIRNQVVPLTASSLLSITPVAEKELVHVNQNYTNCICVSNRGNNIILDRRDYKSKIRALLFKLSSYLHFKFKSKGTIAPLPRSLTSESTPKPKYILSNGASIFIRIQDGRKFNDVPQFEFSQTTKNHFNTETMSLILSAYSTCSTDRGLLEELFGYVSYYILLTHYKLKFYFCYRNRQ